MMLRGVSLLSTLFLGACASTAPQPLGSDLVESSTPVDVSVPVAHDRESDESCDTILRDLSVDWESRDYWCDNGRLLVRRTVLLASLEKARQQLAALRLSAESIETAAGRAVARIDARLADEPRPVPLPVENVEKLPPVVHRPVHTARAQSQHPRIVFARGREVLGPRGRRAAAALAQRVATARNVTVRGHLSENEFSLVDPLDAERRSVGRSLSVKEAWRNAGIDVTSVTILHHSGDFAGAFVEVVIGD